MISIKSYKPCLPLQNYIESFHVVENTGNQTIRHQQRVTPNGCFEINFNLGAKIYRRESNGKNQLHPEFCIGSRVTKQYFLSRKGDIKILGIRFYPWGITPFLKIKASEISDNIFSLEEVFGNEIKTLQEQVLNANSISDAICAIEAHLIKKMYDIDKDDKIVTDAIKTIYTSKGHIGLQSLLLRYNISERRLQQRFQSAVGMNPKLYSRLVRFQNSLNQLKNCEMSLTTVTYLCNYFDQAHFIRDFKYFSGITPKKYLQEKHPLDDMLSLKTLAAI